MAKLMSGVRQRDGLRAHRERIACQHLGPLGRGELVGVKPQFFGEGTVDLQHAWRTHPRGGYRREESRGEACVGVFEADSHRPLGGPGEARSRRRAGSLVQETGVGRLTIH